MAKMYLAVLEGPEKISIVDVNTGIKTNYVNTGGKIINGPIVTGNLFTVVVQKNSGAKMARIYNMPSGTLHNQFEV